MNKIMNIFICFNLNLLECKLSSIFLKIFLVCVLILTYWNVNSGISDMENIT